LKDLYAYYVAANNGGFTPAATPDGYKTFSQLKVSELHLYEYAGTCCTTYGDQGHMFKLKGLNSV
jgi:hypothetical protein